MMIDDTTYRDKVFGALMGKNIGGTLGGPYEGHMAPLFLHYYDPVPTEPIPNDDFELQLVWLDMLNREGVRVTPRDLAGYWRKHISYCISEYFMGKRNMAQDILPPMSGAFNNWYINGMGAAIRSEIWALIAPGMPDIAAAYAYMDASTDHTGEGVHGAMFFAAIESAAFVETDPRKLIDIGLSYVPSDCRVRDVTELVLSELGKGTDWFNIRHLICAYHSSPCDFTYVPTNLGITVLGWLSGECFGERLCNAVNCGYDTDCTGATLGSILGIIAGAKGIPREWSSPVGTDIKVSEYIAGVNYAPDIQGVAEQMCCHGREVMSDPGAIRDHLAKWTGLGFLGSARPTVFGLPEPTRVRLAESDGLAIEFDYLDDPAIGYDEPKSVVLTVRNEGSRNRRVELSLAPPRGWSVRADSPDALAFDLVTASSFEAKLTVSVGKGAEIEPANLIRVALMEDGRAGLSTEFALLGKSCWLVTSPIPEGKHERIRAIEKLGELDGDALVAHPMQIESDDLSDLIPAEGCVVFAQTDFYCDDDINVRVVANNTGPVRLFLNGKMIIDKRHWSPGIMPSWHLQNIKIHILPKDLGCTDVKLNKGWNRVMIRFTGSERPQEMWFHLVRIASDTIEGAQWKDYGLLKGVSNTRWRHETAGRQNEMVQIGAV